MKQENEYRINQAALCQNAVSAEALEPAILRLDNSESNLKTDGKKVERNKPRMIIACDFDGTIYRHDGRGFLPQDVQAAIAFRKHGGITGINTGRSFKSLRPGLNRKEQRIFDAFDFQFYAGSRGAELADAHENLLICKTIDPDTVRKIEEMMPVMVFFAAAKGMYQRNAATDRPFALGATPFSRSDLNFF